VGTVVFDADIIIGFLDPADAQHDRAVEVVRPWLSAGNTRLVAASVYAEILVRPMRVGLSDKMETFLAEAGIEVVSIDRAIARRAAVLRAEHQSLKLPDALACATAIERDAHFLSLDERLTRLVDHLC
jgi:predicted nucleic acid-binding protein